MGTDTFAVIAPDGYCTVSVIDVSQRMERGTDTLKRGVDHGMGWWMDGAWMDGRTHHE